MMIEEEITHLSDSMAMEIHSWMEEKKMDIEGWRHQEIYQLSVQDNDTGNNARQAVSDQLSKMLQDQPFFEHICVADKKGDIVASGNPAIIGKINIMDREYFKQSMQGHSYISGVLQSRDSGNPVFFISVPLQENQDVQGILYGVIKMEYINKRYLDRIRTGNFKQGLIWDENGMVVAHSDRSFLGKNIKDTPLAGFMGQHAGLFHYQGSMTSLKKIEKLSWTVAVTVSESEIFTPVWRISFINFAVSGAVLFFIGICILFLVNSTVTPINRIADGLRDASERFSGASGHIEEASQILSEGASEQASSLEESSSSLEEMAAMTRQNANRAGQANGLSKNAFQVVDEANQTMSALNRSMMEISGASKETQKIIKTIDEIAFQTNLLALNAAVEAARAGEAGAGFAVVADEVRNLAMRSAEAAKNTAVLIAGTVKKVGEGTGLVSKTDTAFKKVAEAVSKVRELVDEIAAASDEQAQGIEQMTQSASDIDKITQQNAANAEETASSAQEMSVMARQMKGYVDELQAVVSGESTIDAGKNHKKVEMKSSRGIQISARPPAKIGTKKTKSSEVRPDQVIPFDDEDNFTEF